MCKIKYLKTKKKIIIGIIIRMYNSCIIYRQIKMHDMFTKAHFTLIFIIRLSFYYSPKLILIIILNKVTNINKRKCIMK